MTIRTEEVTSVLMRFYCEKCGLEMKCGQALLSHPLQYTHYCECGNTENLTSAYPRVAYLDSKGNEVK